LTLEHLKVLNVEGEVEEGHEVVNKLKENQLADTASLELGLGAVVFYKNVSIEHKASRPNQTMCK
jgi:hypothetical protein